MERRTFLQAGAAAGIGIGMVTAGAAGAAVKSSSRVGAPMKDRASLKGAALDLTTPAGNREAWAKLQAQYQELAALPFPVPPRGAAR